MSDVIRIPSAPSIFKHYNLQKIPDPPTYLTREIPARSVSTWAAEGGVGKSYLGLEVGFCLAIGVGEFNRPETREKRTTIIVDMENGEWLMTVRLHALMRARDLDPTDPEILGDRLHIIDGMAMGFSLDNERHLVGLYDDIQAYKADLVILDPVMAMMEGNSYDNSTVRHLMDHKIRPITGLGAAVLVDHHTRKDSADPGLNRGSQNVMGARAWIDAADEAFKFRDIGKPKVLAEHVKGRLLGQGDPFILNLDLPPRGTPVHEMRSRIFDEGLPQRTLSKETAAMIHLTQILRLRVTMNASDLDEAVAEKTGCSVETAKKVRHQALSGKIIRQLGDARTDPFELVNTDE